MNSNLENLIQFFSNKLFPFALSFLDDALLLLFSKLGVNIPGLQWFCTTLMMGSLAYWIIRFLYRHYHN